MPEHHPPSRKDQQRALWLSTFAFTLCFAVWTIFSIIGITIKAELGLTEFQYGLLIATPVLTGSLTRLILGVWTERFGGRLVFSLQMILTGVATYLLTLADSYATFLLAALGVGLAGGSFIIGVAYVSKWFPAERQGLALGTFGMGNVGAAVTKFLAPFVLVAMGWQGVAEIWAAAIALMGVAFWLLAKDDPDFAARKARGVRAPTLAEQFAPLKNLQVWRFSLYYFFVFGGFVALALWLPHYLIGVYGFDVRTAGMVGAAYSIPASIFRAYGGVLSDRIGARKVMYATFAVSLVATAILALPAGVPVGLFLAVIFVLGFFMSLGKAAVYKHIPTYYPQNVGAVGGLVGMIGGLGGFVLPLLFGWLKDQTGLWSSCFAVLFLLVAACAIWMHASIRRLPAPALQAA